MNNMSRRHFLKCSAIGALSTLIPFMPSKVTQVTRIAPVSTGRVFYSQGFKKAMTRHSLDNMLSGGVLKIYSGAAPDMASRSNGKLIASIKLKD